MSKELILREHEARHPDLGKLAAQLRVVVEQLAGRSECPIHSVSHRSKSVESLRRKLARPDRTYESLDDVPKRDTPVRRPALPGPL